MARPQHGGMRDMTVGSPAKQILLFTLPLLAGNFLQQLYNMVDSWVVGNYVSDAALAAVGTGFPVIFFFSSLFMGLSTGGTVVISQFYGAGQMDRVHDAVDTIYAAFLRLILPMTALAMLAAKPLLHVLQVDETAMDEALTYLLVVCGGLIGTVGYNFNAGILNGLGNSRTTLLFLSIAAGLNIVLDLVLVLVIPLGVLGVALGTVISQAFSWLFGLFYINRHFPELRIRLFRGKLDKPLFREIVRIGLPAGLQMSMVSLGTMAILSKVNSFGKAFTAGMNVGNKLDSLAFLPTQSLAAGITAFVGQNMGAGREDRAHQGIRATVLAADVWTVFTALILCLFSESFIGIFSPDAPVIAAGSYYLRCVMPPYVLFATLFVLNAAMRGAGDSVFPMLNVAASLILIRVPAVYLLADHFGPHVMFWGYGIGWVLGCGLSVWYYVTGRWKRRFRPPERRAPESPPEGEM